MTSPRPARRPNLLLVIADQWRAGCLGFLGEDPVHTPSLDRLAGRSRVLTQAVSNYPVCSPCRAMLMTGRYPYRNGVHLNVNSATAELGVGLRPETRCWSDALSEAGYALGYIGKWHLEAPVAADAAAGEGVRADGRVWDAYTAPGRRHGFGFWYSHGCCDDHARPHYWTGDAPREAPVRVDQWSAEHETDVALSFLAGPASRDFHRTGRPFALVMSYNPPHQPFDQVPQRYLQPYSGRAPRDLLPRPNIDWGRPEAAQAAEAAPYYYAAVTAVDHQVGRLLAALDDHGLRDDTFVVFTSDHGMQLGSHGLMYKNVPYEESMRVPLLVSHPTLTPGRDDLLLSSPDIAPTLLGLLGQADRIPEGTQGRDLSEALLGRPAERPAGALYMRPAAGPRDTDVRGLRTRAHKLTAEYAPAGTVTVRLFDLAADPYERTDVAARHPAQVAVLGAALAAELDRTGDPWPGRAALAQAIRPAAAHGRARR
jgi:arylsulfatase A-like enzyme